MVEWPFRAKFSLIEINSNGATRVIDELFPTSFMFLEVLLLSTDEKV